MHTAEYMWAQRYKKIIFPLKSENKNNNVNLPCFMYNRTHTLHLISSATYFMNESKQHGQKYWDPYSVHLQHTFCETATVIMCFLWADIV